MRGAILLLTFLLSIPNCAVVANVAYQSGQDSASPAVASSQAAYRVPFEFYGNRIYLRARVNNSAPFWFILDSGAPDAYISMEQARALGLDLRRSVGITGTGEGRIMGAFLGRATFHLGEAQLSDDRSVAAPQSFFDSFTPLAGRAFAGIIGADLFYRFVVEIDYAGQVITLHEPRSYRYAGSGEVIPLNLIDRKPYIRTSITTLAGATLAGNFHVDAGCSGTLGLNRRFIEESNLIDEARRAIESLNIGAGGESRVNIGRVRTLRLGRLAVENPVTSFAQAQGRGVRADSAGRICGGILRRFKVILDYSRRQMILEPNAARNDPFEFDMSGIVMVSEGLAFKVYRLLANSPASEIGLREGDIILAIDERPTSELTLEEARQLFKEAGRERLLQVRRGTEQLEFRLRLRRLV